MSEVDAARDELRHAHAAGRPYLVCAGVWLLALAPFAPSLGMRTLALLTLVHALVAPVLVALYLRLRRRSPSGAGPLAPLARRTWLIPVVGLPAGLLALSWYPIYVPAIYAAVCGAMLLPWAWLYASRVYTWLALVVALPPLVLSLRMRERSLPWVLGLWGSAYLLAALWLWWSRRSERPAAAG